MIRAYTKVISVYLLILLLIISLNLNVMPHIQAKTLNPNDFTIVYNFETGTGGWEASTSSGLKGITTTEWSSRRAIDGEHSVELGVELDTGLSSNRSGEVYVDMLSNPPDGYPPSQLIDLTNKTISAWVYVPAEARGDPNAPNGIHLFAQDIWGSMVGGGYLIEDGNKLYGTWQNLPGEGWFQVILPVSGNPPACGSIIPGPDPAKPFDPSAIWKVGVNIVCRKSHLQALTVKSISMLFHSAHNLHLYQITCMISRVQMR
jgi:hypothetical protein